MVANFGEVFVTGTFDAVTISGDANTSGLDMVGHPPHHQQFGRHGFYAAAAGLAPTCLVPCINILIPTYNITITIIINTTNTTTAPTPAPDKSAYQPPSYTAADEAPPVYTPTCPNSIIRSNVANNNTTPTATPASATTTPHPRSNTQKITNQQQPHNSQPLRRRFSRLRRRWQQQSQPSRNARVSSIIIRQVG